MALFNYSINNASESNTETIKPEYEGFRDKLGAVAQSVERATPAGEEAPCSIPAVAARSLLVGSVSV